VGYAGGAKPNPTYRDMGDHAESIQIDFDPAVVSFERLAELFWSAHNPCASPYSRQYASILFFENEEQRRVAISTREREEKRRGRKIETEVLPLGEFTRAEAYHQKYYLRNHPSGRALREAFASDEAFVDSTEAARANARLGGHRSAESMQK
jgi:peptide-methionine (S)-S-oxide reductase